MLPKLVKTVARELVEDYRKVRQGRVELRRDGTTYLNYWKEGNTHKEWWSAFLRRPALAAIPERKKLALVSVFGRRRVVSLVNAPVNIFYTGENLNRYPDYLDHGGPEMELALGFEEGDTAKYLRFPNWIIVLFTGSLDRAGIAKKIAEFEAASADFASRTKFASLIARHDPKGHRSELADLTERLGGVDYPSTFRHNSAHNLPPGYPSKLDYLKDYQFNLCPENSNAPGYVTEKIFHAIAAGCLPVYWGSNNQPERAVLNQEAVLFYNPEEPVNLLQEMEDLVAQPEKLEAFARQPRFQTSAADYVWERYRLLEERMVELLR